MPREVPVWEQAGYCRELLLALVAKPEVVEGLTRQAVFNEIESGRMTQALAAMRDRPAFDHRTLIRDMLDRVSPAARRHFAAALKDRCEIEALHHIMRAVTSRIDRVAVTEVEA